MSGAGQAVAVDASSSGPWLSLEGKWPVIR
jgi:hypothetical protein